ncbi:MAG: hypothetical protein JXA92_00370 [candidate division Zixibacteria bacterium]|nr:hypothetical protein [candidate division Zixibacteria bacterium]
MRRYYLFSGFVILIVCFQSGRASVGPFNLYAADSSSYVRLQMVGQLRSELQIKETASDDDRECEFYTKFRRIRLTASGSVLNPDFTFKLHLSTAPGSLELMDFYFNYQLDKNLQFRYGQFKLPFTRYRIQSFQRLTFADWAVVTKYFGAERQMGLALHNGFERPPRWGFVFGVFNGANARASHGIGIAEIYNEDTPNPSDLTDPVAVEKFHPEIVCHGSFNSDDIDVGSDTDDSGDKWRLSSGVSAAYDFDPVARRDFSLRLAVEVLTKYRGFSFSSVGYTGYFKRDNDSKTEPAMTGALVQTAYRFYRRCELALRYALVDIRTALIRSAENTLEDDELDGLLHRDEELTAGFNFYISGHGLKWQIDAGSSRRTYAACSTTDYLIRSQVQLSF